MKKLLKYIGKGQWKELLSKAEEIFQIEEAIIAQPKAHTGKGGGCFCG